MPISTPMAVVVYLTIWWIVLFAILPWGIQSQDETGNVVPGSEPGAPTVPRLLVKALWTTVVSALVFGFVLMLFSYWR